MKFKICITLLKSITFLFFVAWKRCLYAVPLQKARVVGNLFAEIGLVCLKVHRLNRPLQVTTKHLPDMVPRQFVYRHFVYDTVYRHFVYRQFVYYCIQAYRTDIHPTSVLANHYFHQFQLLLALWFLSVNPTSTDTIIIQHISNPACSFS